MMVLTVDRKAALDLVDRLLLEEAANVSTTLGKYEGTGEDLKGEWIIPYFRVRALYAFRRNVIPGCLHVTSDEAVFRTALMVALLLMETNGVTAEELNKKDIEARQQVATKLNGELAALSINTPGSPAPEVV